MQPPTGRHLSTRHRCCRIPMLVSAALGKWSLVRLQVSISHLDVIKNLRGLNQGGVKKLSRKKKARCVLSWGFGGVLGIGLGPDKIHMMMVFFLHCSGVIRLWNSQPQTPSTVKKGNPSKLPYIWSKSSLDVPQNGSHLMTPAYLQSKNCKVNWALKTTENWRV